jgi:hypothetical protein
MGQVQTATASDQKFSSHGWLGVAKHHPHTVRRRYFRSTQTSRASADHDDRSRTGCVCAHKWFSVLRPHDATLPVRQISLTNPTARHGQGYNLISGSYLFSKAAVVVLKSGCLVWNAHVFSRWDEVIGLRLPSV